MPNTKLCYDQFSILNSQFSISLFPVLVTPRIYLKHECEQRYIYQASLFVPYEILRQCHLGLSQ